MCVIIQVRRDNNYLPLCHVTTLFDYVIDTISIIASTIIDQLQSDSSLIILVSTTHVCAVHNFLTRVTLL